MPIDSDEYVYLVRQFRYALGKESIEVVCGAVEEDEPNIEAAKREIEEVGIKASELIDLGVVNLDTSIVDCAVQMFIAKQLTKTEANPEGRKTICSARSRSSFAMSVCELHSVHAERLLQKLRSHS